MTLPQLEPGPPLQPAELEEAPEAGHADIEPAGPADGLQEPVGTKIAHDLQPLAVPIGSVQPHPGNPRRHPHLEELRASYRRWGQYRAVVVQASTGYVVAGNGLLEVMLSEGATEIAVNGLELSQREADALLLADNRLADLGAYDQEALAQLLDEQDATGDLAGTGYTGEDLDRIMRGLETGKAEVDDVPPLAVKPWVEYGQAYALGDHRIACGDATHPDTWAQLFAGTDELAGMIWTDPPYGVEYAGGTDEHLRIQGDGKYQPALAAMLRSTFELALARTAQGRAVYCAAPGGAQGMVFLQTLIDLGVYRQTIVWVKDQLVLGRSDYHWRHENLLAGANGDTPPARSKKRHKEGQPVHYGWRPGAAHYFADDRTLDTVWEFPRPKASREHPTMKPVALVERSLLASSKRGELVLDPFVGSGTTIIAAATTRRRCYAIDIDPRYAQAAIERWQTFTGEQAVRL
jgi:site-specific DNA-methyltransferase (adenine-specific)